MQQALAAPGVIEKWLPSDAESLRGVFAGLYSLDVADGASVDAIVAEAGGRVYLGKDARLSIEAFRRMYPRWDEWKQVRDKWDPAARFQSELSRRLGQDRRLFRLLRNSRAIERGTEHRFFRQTFCRAKSMMSWFGRLNGHAIITAVHDHFSSRDEGTRFVGSKQKGGSDQLFFVAEPVHGRVGHD